MTFTPIQLGWPFIVALVIGMVIAVVDFFFELELSTAASFIIGLCAVAAVLPTFDILKKLFVRKHGH